VDIIKEAGENVKEILSGIDKGCLTPALSKPEKVQT
jgi:hypothetical protein